MPGGSAQALERLGMKPGDRVATLAMNHDRHLVAWFGVVGMGGVLHTLNPRLFDDQLEYIANHAEDRVLLYDRAFAPIVERLKPQLATIEHTSASTTNSTAAGSAEDGDYTWYEGDERDPAGSATPAARLATPRACSTSTARPCFTR